MGCVDYCTGPRIRVNGKLITSRKVRSLKPLRGRRGGFTSPVTGLLPRKGCGRKTPVVYWRRQGQGGAPPLAALKKSLLHRAFGGQPQGQGIVP
jgi:hypothetical protein